MGAVWSFEKCAADPSTENLLMYSADPSTENFEQLEILKSKYDAYFDYLSKGAIIRCRASLYEKGEKNTKYFLSLESHKKAKSCVGKVFTKNGTLSSDPKIIMNELEDFCIGLYHREGNLLDCANLFLRHPEIPKLSPKKAATCEGKLTMEECLHSLQSFKEKKSPGNDGLTVEFYKTFLRKKLRIRSHQRVGRQSANCRPTR